MYWLEELVGLDGLREGGWVGDCFGRGADGGMVGGLVLGLDGK